tara:strand:+ start:1862 stop:3136 length:1275 start_codon:yes stop_codon:yes gene_type:complete
MKKCDVIIIGAGPAGTATALLLKKMGYEVILLEQAKFPRDKVCGEFISPAADSILNELGVLASIKALSPLRLRGVFLSSYEKIGMFVDYPDMPYNPDPVTSLSLPRIEFDNLMLGKVREAGVEIREEHKVLDFIFQDGAVVGVTGRDAQRTPFTLKAPIVVDAGGRNCISLRKLNLKIPPKSSEKTAIAAHWEGVKSLKDYCYMHVSRPGYTGIAPASKDLTNVVLVLDSFHLKGRRIEDLYLKTVLKNRQRNDLLTGGRLTEKPRVVNSLAYSVKSPSCGGLVLVGDAMGFIDPFTGEGIYLSLRSAQIATDIIDRAFKNSDFSQNFLSQYEIIRMREFREKFMLVNILQKLIYNPPLCTRVLKILSRNPALAKLLVGVTGDYIPAKKVVSVKFLLRLVSGAILPQEKDPLAQRIQLQSVLRD